MLQARIGFLQLAGHPVELVGELLDLVLGVDLDAVVELAGSQPPRAGLQLVDRHHHVPRQQYSGDDGEREAQSQQPADPDQEAVDRRDRLVERLLEQHEQIDARNRGSPDQHLMPAGIFADRGRLGADNHRGDLGQAGEIGPDPPVGVGTREQAAVRSHDIGISEPAGVSRGDEIGEEFQVELGDGDAGIAPWMGHGEHHVGHVAAKAYRRPPAAAGDRLGKAGITGIVGAAAQRDIETRHPQLLAAIAVELGKFVDGRRPAAATARSRRAAAPG